MKTVHSFTELHQELDAWRAQGQRISLVPTMGNLHRGHLHLVKEAGRRADRVVASVFVNPLQFGPNEDFERYPRTLAQDQLQLAGAGCDLLFAPDAAQVYPRGRDAVCTVKVPAEMEVLEGECRPGHFDGVATVVSILFHAVQPDVALFGRKDYQQLQVIRRMAADLHLRVRVEGVDTQRDADGLALSSRNQYLSDAERRAAPGLYAALRQVAQRLQSGESDYEALGAEAQVSLAAQGFRPQYLVIRRPDLTSSQPGDAEWVILVAAYLGTTRLIDNLTAARA